METGEAVVKPLVEKRFFSPLWRLLFADAEPLSQRDIQHIFFLSDSNEKSVKQAIFGGLIQVWLIAALWLVSSLWMFGYQQPRIASGFDHWTIREIMTYAPSRVKLASAIQYLDYDRGESGRGNDFIRKIPLLGGFFAEVESNLLSALRTDVINYLWKFEPDEQRLDYLELYLSVLHSENNALRRVVVHKIAIFKSFAYRVVPALADALADEQREVQVGSAHSLAKFGAAGAKAVPALIEVLGRNDAELRKIALFALYYLPLEPETGLLLFSKFRDHGDADVRRGVARIVGRFGESGALAVTGLIEMLRDVDGYVRQSAVVALGEIGPGAVEAVDELVACLDDDTLGTRQFTATALGKIGPGARSAGPALIALLSDDNQWVRSEAVRALRLMGVKGSQ